MKISDESPYISFCKAAFSDILEGVTSKDFSEGNPSDSHFLPVYVGTTSDMPRPFPLGGGAFDVLTNNCY